MNYTQKYLKNYYNKRDYSNIEVGGGFRGDFWVGLTLVAIVIMVMALLK